MRKTLSNTWKFQPEIHRNPGASHVISGDIRRNPELMNNTGHNTVTTWSYPTCSLPVGGRGRRWDLLKLFSLTGTVSTSPNLAEARARRASKAQQFFNQ